MTEGLYNLFIKDKSITIFEHQLILMSGYFKFRAALK